MPVFVLIIAVFKDCLEKMNKKTKNISLWCKLVSG